MPEYERCNRITTPKGDCKINHIFGVQSITENVYVAGQGRTWLTVEFDLTKGTWKTISPSDGTRYTAQIPKLDFDQICGGDVVVTDTRPVGAWDWSGHGFGRPDSSVWYRFLENPSCSNGLVGKVQIQDTSSSSDTSWVLGGRFQFNFIKQVEDQWSPQECIDDAIKAKDGFCKGDVTYTDAAINAEKCVMAGGIRICPGDVFYNNLKPSPIPGIPITASSVQVSKLECDFNVGQGSCWTDPEGNKVCIENEGGNNNTCKDLEANPDCGFISSECLEGAEGPSGTCYVFKDTYDCGYDVTIPTIDSETSYECAGDIACLGSDCLELEQEQSKDFAEAAALLNVAQFATQDMECSEGATDEGGDENVDEGCIIFSGKPAECKIAVGGMQDCCEAPEGISLNDYITLLMATSKLDAAAMAVKEPGMVVGAYQELMSPVHASFDKVTKPFTSFAEGITGETGVIGKLDQWAGDMFQSINEQLGKLMSKAFGNASTAVGGATGGPPLSESVQGAMDTVMNSAAGQIISAINMAYTAYVVATVLVNIIWECEEEELELNTQKELKNCTYIGSYCKSDVLGACIEERETYCCFMSPLSRIIQEQARPQLGMSFGDPENLSCDGLPLESISEIDWDKINLDEWLGILQTTGNLPDPNMTMDSLTGKGSVLNLDENRPNAVERSIDRYGETKVDEIRRTLTDEMDVNTGAPTGGG